jgi:thiol-disulfide isomerase/thioredoxin
MKLTPTVLIGLTAIAIGAIKLPAIAFSPMTITAKQSISQTESIALAGKTQSKPIVVDIYASWCPGCKNIAPTLSQLKQKYGNKVDLVMFDVSDRQTTAASAKLAAKLGLTDFFEANKSQTATVAIVDPDTGKIIKQFRNNPNLTAYTSIIDNSLAMKKGAAMKKP